MALSLRIRKSRFKNRSEASKANWAKVSKEERSKRMSRIAAIRQSYLTPEEKHLHAMKMVKARQ